MTDSSKAIKSRTAPHSCPPAQPVLALWRERGWRMGQGAGAWSCAAGRTAGSKDCPSTLHLPRSWLKGTFPVACGEKTQVQPQPWRESRAGHRTTGAVFLQTTPTTQLHTHTLRTITLWAGGVWNTVCCVSQGSVASWLIRLVPFFSTYFSVA